jgi:hypothetical protein
MKKLEVENLFKGKAQQVPRCCHWREKAGNTSGYGIKESVQRDFLDVAVRGRVHCRKRLDDIPVIIPAQGESGK